MLCYAFVTPGHASVHPSALYWSELRVLYIIFGFVSTYACFMLCYACVTPWHASVSVCLSERSDMCPCLPVCLSVRPSVRPYVRTCIRLLFIVVCLSTRLLFSGLNYGYSTYSKSVHPCFCLSVCLSDETRRIPFLCWEPFGVGATTFTAFIT